MLADMPDATMPLITVVRILDDEDCGGCGDGECVFPEGEVVDSSSTLGNEPSCDCRDTGFIGENCEIECSIDCENGGKCIPASAESESYDEATCSCSKAVVDGNPYAGLRCEYGATKSCMTLGSESKHSFCTNGGECPSIVGDNEQHTDCICDEEFEGSHCEYVKGTAPVIAGASSAETDNSFQVNSTSDVWVYIMIAVIASLIVVLVLAFFARGRKRRLDAKRREKELREATEELSMIPTHNNPEENDII